MFPYLHIYIYPHIYIPIHTCLEDICVHLHNHTYIWLHLSYKSALAPKTGSLVVVSALWGWRREEPGQSCSHRQPPLYPGPFAVLGPALLSPAAHAPNSLNFWMGGSSGTSPMTGQSHNAVRGGKHPKMCLVPCPQAIPPSLTWNGSRWGQRVSMVN